MTTAITVLRVRRITASRRVRAGVRAAAGIGILVAIALHVGAEPFLAGLAAVSAPTVAAALVLGAAATVAAAWRWRLIAARLGLRLGGLEAISAYYRSQLLNSVLPGGVIGDVDRVMRHGRAAGELGDATRAVAAERAAGQAVQLVAVVGVLVWLREFAYAPAVALVLAAILVAVAACAAAAGVSVRARALLGREIQRLRLAFGSVPTVVGVSAASVVVIACHVATFVIAALAVGVDAPPPVLVSTALLAVLAGAIPLGVGGWGPREGVAAWAFAAAGLGASAGVAASTAFGVLALVAVAPGAAVIAVTAVRARRRIDAAGDAA